MNRINKILILFFTLMITIIVSALLLAAQFNNAYADSIENNNRNIDLSELNIDDPNFDWSILKGQPKETLKNLNIPEKLQYHGKHDWESKCEADRLSRTITRADEIIYSDSDAYMPDDLFHVKKDANRKLQFNTIKYSAGGKELSFDYNIRGLLGDNGSCDWYCRSNVQFFVNSNIQKMIVLCFAGYKDNYETYKYHYHSAANQFSQTDTFKQDDYSYDVRLSNEIKYIELDTKLKAINTYSLGFIHSLESVDIINECYSEASLTDIYSLAFFNSKTVIYDKRVQFELLMIDVAKDNNQIDLHNGWDDEFYWEFKNKFNDIAEQERILQTKQPYIEEEKMIEQEGISAKWAWHVPTSASGKKQFNTITADIEGKHHEFEYDVRVYTGRLQDKYKDDNRNTVQLFYNSDTKVGTIICFVNDVDMVRAIMQREDLYIYHVKFPSCEINLAEMQTVNIDPRINTIGSYTFNGIRDLKRIDIIDGLYECSKLRWVNEDCIRYCGNYNTVYVDALTVCNWHTLNISDNWNYGTKTNCHIYYDKISENIRKSRTKNYFGGSDFNETPCINSRYYVYKVNGSPTPYIGNKIDDFEYHYRGLLGDNDNASRKASVQFFLNKLTGLMKIITFGNDAMDQENIYYFSQQWNGVFNENLTFEDDTVRLSNYIKSIEFSSKTNEIQTGLFNNLNYLKDVSFSRNYLYVPCKIQHDAFSYCGLLNDRIDPKDSKTHLINFHYKEIQCYMLNVDADFCRFGAKPVICD